MMKKCIYVLSYVLMVFIALGMGSCICFIMTSCGHTTYHKVEGTGLYGMIPLTDGTPLVEVAIGDISITNGMLRGGSTYDENTSKGGSIGSISLGRHTFIATEPAINEGYIESVLTSENTDPLTKQMLTTYLITRDQRSAQQSTTTSVNSATATGTEPLVAVPTQTGLDHAINKAADIAPNVITPITDTAKILSSEWKHTVLVVVASLILTLVIVGCFLVFRVRRLK